MKLDGVDEVEVSTKDKSAVILMKKGVSRAISRQEVERALAEYPDYKVTSFDRTAAVLTKESRVDATE